jgi:KDO2-lipid IV(A) lauroyltransferase
MRVVPRPVAYALAGLAGRTAWLVARDRRRTVLHTLGFLVQGSTTAVRQRLGRATFTNLFQAAIDLFRLPSSSPEEVLGLVRIVGREHLETARSLGKGVVVVTPHLGPYELGAAVLAALGYDVHGMVEDIDPETNAALAKYRGATGLKLISRQHGLRALYRVLKEGAVALLVADRVVGEGSEGLVVPFAAGRRPVPTGPASFSVATGAPVVVGYISRSRSNGPRYVITIEPPIFPGARSPLAVESLTRQIAARLAAAVSLHPDQWFVFQPGWVERDGNA